MKVVDKSRVIIAFVDAPCFCVYNFQTKEIIMKEFKQGYRCTDVDIFNNKIYFFEFNLNKIIIVSLENFQIMNTISLNTTEKFKILGNIGGKIIFDSVDSGNRCYLDVLKDSIEIKSSSDVRNSIESYYFYAHGILEHKNNGDIFYLNRWNNYMYLYKKGNLQKYEKIKFSYQVCDMESFLKCIFVSKYANENKIFSLNNFIGNNIEYKNYHSERLMNNIGNQIYNQLRIIDQ